MKQPGFRRPEIDASERGLNEETMNLPFTVEQFFGVFARYNEAVWPMQLVLNALAVVAVGLAFQMRRSSDRVILTILGFLWLWTGVAYHLLFFTTINPAAYLFATVSVAEAAVFFILGLRKTMPSFRFRPVSRGVLGSVLIAYALVVYPLLGYLFGHRYPHSPTFGLPCPTTIFTFGMLLWTDRKVPAAALFIPLLWAGIGSLAAASLGITEDIGLGVAAVVVALTSFARTGRQEAAQARHA
jgi:hypothetical protein